VKVKINKFYRKKLVVTDLTAFEQMGYNEALRRVCIPGNKSQRLPYKMCQIDIIQLNSTAVTTSEITSTDRRLSVCHTKPLF